MKPAEDDMGGPITQEPHPREGRAGAAPAAAEGGRAHIAALDGLRGLAILSVMIFHQTVMDRATPFDGWYYRLTSELSGGVDLFFVLSGFLITGILFDGKGSANYFRNFFARRALRIFPLYYAVLFASLVVLPAFAHAKLSKWGDLSGPQQLWYWLYLSNWRIGWVGFNHGILDISWSLAIEEQFYLAWPFVVALTGRKTLIKTCLALIVAAFAFRLLAAGACVMGEKTFTTSRMDTLAIGALIALLARGPGGIAALVPAARWIGAGSFATLVASRAAMGQGGPGADHVLHGLGYLATALVCGALLVLVVAAKPGSILARGLTGRALVAFGTYSYALYLFHYPIMALIRDLAFRPERFPTLLGSPLPGQLMFYAIATAPALVAAWLSWNLFEKHFLKLKRYFTAARPARGRLPAAEAAQGHPALVADA